MKLNSMASRREFLEGLSTAELDEMLQVELRKETIDDDPVRLVLSVLEDREKDCPVELNEEIAAAAEKFGNSIVAPQIAPARKKWPPVLKAASILVVVGMLLFALPQAAHAESFFELLARWTESVFEFFNPAEEQDEQPEYVFKTDHPGLQQIYDAVVEMGVTEPVVPMWVPEGYVLKDINCYQSIDDTVLFASLLKEKQNIYFTVILHDEVSTFQHEKDMHEIEQIEINGVKHYVVSNLEENTVAWMINGVECSIVTDCRDEELLKLLISIYN